MNFGARFAFDAGQCTGPFLCSHNGSQFRVCAGPSSRFDVTGFESQAEAYEWGNSGSFVGCNTLGDVPYPTSPVHYPGAVWYSLPGSCNSKMWSEHDEQCEERQPGGLCSGTSTGQGNCTWSYEEAGEISVNELVGIPDNDKFLQSGRREYDEGADRGFGFTWWDSVHDRLANLWRIQKAQELFKKRYPDADLTLETAPPCDVDHDTFYSGFSFSDCHDAVVGEECHAEVTWAMQDGIRLHPDWYPGLTRSSGFKDFQDLFFRTTIGSCYRPPCFP